MFGTEVTSAPNCGLRQLMLTSAPCKWITCAKVNDLCRRSSPPKFIYSMVKELKIKHFVVCRFTASGISEKVSQQTGNVE